MAYTLTGIVRRLSDRVHLRAQAPDQARSRRALARARHAAMSRALSPSERDDLHAAFNRV